MKTRNFTNAVRNALLIFGFLFLPVSSVQAAPSANPTTFTFLPKLEGLRFETPISPQLSIEFISQLQTTSQSEKPLIISSSREPHASLLDILVPEVKAEESSQSALLLENESSMSALIVEPVVEQPKAKQKKESPSPSVLGMHNELSEKSDVLPITTQETSDSPKNGDPQKEKPVSSAVPTSSEGLSTGGGLHADKIFELINNYRVSKGLPLLEKDERACEVARSRAPEIGAEIAGGYMHKGIRERNLPYWNSENIISMRSEEAAVNWWINDYIHRVQIEGDYRYSCVACHGNSCVQEFTNFQMKR